MAWDWGQAAGGGVSGFGAGAGLGGPIGAGIGAGIGFVGGGLMGKGEPGGAQWLENPQYSFTEPRNQLTSDFITSNINRMNQGQFPTWYEGIADKLRTQQKRGLSESMFGNQFNPGALQTLESQQVKTGLGRSPSKVTNQTGGLMDSYMQKSMDIDDFISNMGYQAQKESAFQFPQMSNQMAQGPAGQWQGYGAQPSGGQQVMSSLMSLAGTMGKLKSGGGDVLGLSKMFGGGGGVTPMANSFTGLDLGGSGGGGQGNVNAFNNAAYGTGNPLGEYGGSGAGYDFAANPTSLGANISSLGIGTNQSSPFYNAGGQYGGGGQNFSMGDPNETLYGSGGQGNSIMNILNMIMGSAGAGSGMGDSYNSNQYRNF